MSRSNRGTSALWEAICSQETDQVFLLLLTINHSNLSEPMRVVHDRVSHDSRGNTYKPFPFQVQLPDQTQDEIPRVELTIDNVDRQITETLRSIRTAPDVTVEAVLASDPDTVESGPYEYQLTDVNINDITVSGQLDVEDLMNQSFPAHTFSPTDFPGLSPN